MNRKFAIGLALGFVASLAVAATMVVNVPSLSVSQTNYTSEAIFTNGVTIGGVRNTAWPSGGTAGTVVNSGTPVTTAIPTYSGITGTNVSPSSVTISGLTNVNAGSASLGYLTVTNATPISNMTDDWTNSGTVYNGIKLNVTNTASATSSKLIDLQLGSSSYFNVDKSKAAFFEGSVWVKGGLIAAGGKIFLLSLAESANSGTPWITGGNLQPLTIGTSNTTRWLFSLTNGTMYPSTSGSASGAIWVGLGTNTTIARVGGALKTDTTTTGNVGGGEDNLIAYTIPAAVLNSNGEAVSFDCFGSFAATAHLKTLKVVYGATTLISSTSLALNGLDWRCTGKIVRTGATTQKATATMTIGGTLLGSVTTAFTDYTTPAETLSGTVVFKCTGSDDDGSPSSNAVVQEGMVLEWIGNGN